MFNTLFVMETILGSCFAGVCVFLVFLSCFRAWKKERLLSGRVTGQIVDVRKTHAFIEVDNLDEDVFIHNSAVDFTLREGQHLVFDVERGSKGLRAVNVCCAGTE